MSSNSAIIYRFGAFELDPGKFELRASGQPKHLEPQVLSLLILLASNSERMVSKDEVIDEIWGGRIVSDAAVASRVKAARQALGDDGHAQRFIRTVHGKGFRFSERVEFVHPLDPAVAMPRADIGPVVTDIEARPSIAVLPFRVIGPAGAPSFIGDALADELIADLSQLHWLLVIARASTFRFRDRDVDCEEIGAALKVRYCLAGTLEETDRQVALSVTLARAADGGVIWAERFVAGRDELQVVRREMLSAILANLETRIVRHEVDLARRVPDAALDAWACYHLGLDHMYRFNKSDNGKAMALFERSRSIDPYFSRAFSGLSFTSFQDCFLQYSASADEMAQRARSLAEEALRCDPLDPFAHLNLARSLWFEDALPESIERLTDCVALSPNYAQAIYSKAWAEMTQCDLTQSDEDAALALRLSPLDPLRYAMLAVRSVSALLSGDSTTAADLGEKAARSPGAHKHIAIIAALATHASGRQERAAHWVATARELDPHIDGPAFLRSFPFAQSRGRETVERNLRELRL